MDWIKIYYRDGEVQEFKEKGRSGGSYTLSVKYEGAMTIITDEWQATIAIPNDLIEKVVTAPQRYW